LVTPHSDIRPTAASEQPERPTGETPDATYLYDLGQRVRRIRAIRGMSRKVLAQVSGISERYIAQLEGGMGNVSIVLLRRIAAAVSMPVEDLVMDASDDWAAIRRMLRSAAPERIARARQILAGQGLPLDSHPQPIPPDRIALVGLRGAGKSTLGEIVASRLGWKFLELNRQIERSLGLSVTEIYKLYGQDGYRRLELATLREIVASKTGPLLLATGGGIVAEPLSYELLLSSFHTIWVKTSPDEHMNRVRDQGDLRPMANDSTAMQELVTILTNREPLYSRAETVVDTAGRSVEQSAGDLAMAIAQIRK